MGGNTARALLAALVVLVLIGVVAVASTGSTPGGTADTRPPGDVLLDTVFSLILVLLLPAAALLVYGLTQRRAVSAEYARIKHLRTGILGIAIFTAIFVYGVYQVRPPPPPPEAETPIVPLDPVLPTTPPSQPEATDYQPSFAWLPVLVVLAVALVAAGALYFASRRGRSQAAESLAEAVADVLEETLDDLRAETDPRRAVIAAYARLERVLAAHGLPRRVAETSEEYLARILRGLDVGEAAVRRLTDLFERAKFSQHDVDAGMKEAAIDALEQVRDELRTAEVEPQAELVAAGGET